VYTLNISAAAPGSELMFISRQDLTRLLTDHELVKLRNLKLIDFPNDDEIRQKIQEIELVHGNIKKQAFMNAMNTNIQREGIRQLFTDSVKKNVTKWMQGVDQRTL
jgi:hypothetical protein